MQNREIDFQKYEWEAASRLDLVGFERLFYYFIRGIQAFMDLLWFTNFAPPKDYQIPGLFNSPAKFLKVVNHTWPIEISKSIGINDELSLSSLNYHWQRIRQYNRIGMILSPLFVLGATVLVIEISTRVFFDAFVSVATLTGGIYYPGIILITLLLMWITVQISKKLLASLLNKHYADTLTVIGTLNFMVELLRKNALGSKDNRIYLQAKIHQLGQSIILLPYQFKSESQEENQWIYSHFRNMERYIREHERLLVVPKSDSLETLRLNFYELLKILIKGQYGEFKYEPQLSSIQEPTRKSKLIGVLLGFAGLVVPILLLYGLYSNPQIITSSGLDANTVTLIALAWFLLTIDATLKLGIVERIAGLAKTIRDLG